MQTVHQCLNCSKPCVETTIFCDECRASLLERQQSPGTEQERRIIRPTKVRKGLPTFMILGAISLIIGGVLLAVNILQHHPSSLMNTAVTTGPGRVLSPQLGSTTWPGATQTPGVSPIAATPAPGTTTPTPTSIPGTTPTTAPNSCALEVAPAHLSFTATLLQPDPPGQPVTLKATGTCGKPVTWSAGADASWIQLSSSTGTDNGSGSTVTVSVHSNQIIGVYNAHITFSAVDNNGIALQSSPQTISVTLTVLG